MAADEDRVRRRRQAVVHVKIADLLDAAPLHVVEHAALGQGGQRAAVAVRAEENPVLRDEDQAEVPVERGDHALPEEPHVLARQAEPGMLFEIVLRRLVGGVAGHDVPRQRAAAAPARGQDALGVDLEERTAGHGADGKSSFRRIEPQPRALAAGDHDGGDLAGPEQPLARRAGVLARALFLRRGRQPDVIGQLGPARRRRVDPARADVGDQRAEPVEFHRAQLLHQPRAPGRVQLVPPAQHVPLPRVAERRHDFRFRPLV
jgi:hypothetical protein